MSQISPYECSGKQNSLNFLLNTSFISQKIRISSTIINPKKTSHSKISIIWLLSGAEIWLANSTVVDESDNIFELWTGYPNDVKVDSESFLFWGLSPTRFKKNNGFIGCPISLYQTQNRPIFNSFSTNFVLSQSVYSVQSDGYLNILWTLLEIKKSVASFLKSSLSTNLPFISKTSYSACFFNQINSYINCTNIGELLPNKKYSISGKFSIVNDYSFKKLTNAGILEIQTGLGVSITKSRGTYVEIKKNKEYYNENLKTQINNNQIFSYIYSDPTNYNFSSNSIIKTFKNQFLGGGDANSSPKQAVYPSLNETSHQISGLLLMISADTTKICATNYESMLVTSCFSPQNQRDSYAVLLKIVFNNYVLNIPSEDFSKGVQIIGTLFRKSDLANKITNYGGVSDYNSYNNQDKLANNIDFVKQNNSLGVFWHVSVVCKSELLQNFNEIPCYNIKDFNENTPISASGIGFINTNIKSYPSLYADNLVLDFIICFKLIDFDNYSRGAALQNEKKWFLLENEKAGSGIIQGYIITGKAKSYKISFSNVYLDSNNGFPLETNTLFSEYVASYLRFSFELLKQDTTKLKNVGVFLDSDQPNLSYGLFDGLAAYTDENGEVDIADFSNQKNTKGKIMQSDFNQSYNDIFIDFWWRHHSIILPFLSVKQERIEIYLPLQITFSKIISLNIVLFDSLNQVISVYRVYGGCFDSLGPTFLILNSYPLGVSHPIFPLISAWDHTTISLKGCVNGTFIPGLDPELMFYPTEIHSTKRKNPVSFKTNVGFTENEGCKLNEGNNDNNGWGSIFSIYSYDDIWDQTTKWSFSNEESKNTSCLQHTFSYCLNKECSSTSKKYFYTILCSIDNKDFVSQNKMIIDYFKVPVNWGQNYPISKTLSYIYSDPKGVAVLIQPEEYGHTDKWLGRNCLINSVYGIPKQTKDTSFFLQLKTEITYVLKPGRNITIDHIIEGTNNSSSIKINFCQHKVLNCTVAKENVYVLLNIGENDFIISSSNSNFLEFEIFLDTTEKLSTKHFAILNFSGVNVEACMNYGEYSFEVLEDPLNNSIKISDFKMIQRRFSFSFLVESLINVDYCLSFLLGFLANNVNGLSCFIFENGLKSNSWNSIEYQNSGMIKLKAKKFIVEGTNFQMECSIDANLSILIETSSLYSISANLQRNFQNENPIIFSEEVLFSTTQFSMGLMTVSLTKNYDYIGFETEYSFNFTPAKSNISLYGRIYLEFPDYFAPKLNQLGKIECFINNMPAICDFYGEYQLKILPTTMLYAKQVYILKILAIKQSDPQILKNNYGKMIYFALDDDEILENGVIEDAFLDVILPTNNQEMGIIFISDFRYLRKIIRNQTRIKISMELESNILANEKLLLLIKFPSFFGHTRIFELNRLECFFGKDINLIEKFQIEDGQIISISFKNNSFASNDNLNFNLIISNLTTPQEIVDFRVGFQVFLLVNNEVIATSTVGNRNSNLYMFFQTNYLRKEFYFRNSSMAKENFIVNKGYLNNNPIILVVNQIEPMNRSINISIKSEDVWVLPTNILEMKVGFEQVAFFLKDIDKNIDMAQGLFFFQPNFVNFEPIYTLPSFIPFRIINQKCFLKPNERDFDISHNGVSSPIKFDFRSCKPINQITIVANISEKINKEITTLSFENGLKSIEKSIVFENSDNPFTLFFYIFSNSTVSLYDQENINHAALINFYLKEESSIYFFDQNFVYLNYLPDNPNPPTPLQPNIENSIINLGCDQEGKIYFKMGINLNKDDVSLEEIFNKTERVMKEITEPVKNDSNWKIYGFISSLKANKFKQASLIFLLKSAEEYTLFSFCSNLNNINTTKPNNFSWIQPSNGGKNIIISIYFNVSLNTSQKQNISCFLSQIFAIKFERIWTDEANHCESSLIKNFSLPPRPQYKNSSNFEYNFVILPNYLVEVDSTFTEVQKISTTNYSIIDKIEMIKNGANSPPKGLYTLIYTEEASFYLENRFYNVSIVENYTITNDFSINITLQMKEKGYFFVGISNFSTKIPNFNQLFNGLDGENNHLTQFIRASNRNFENIWFNFSALSSNQTYSLFFAGSNYDTSPNSIKSLVKRFEVSTKVGIKLDTSGQKIEGILRQIYFLFLILGILLFK